MSKHIKNNNVQEPINSSIPAGLSEEDKAFLKRMIEENFSDKFSKEEREQRYEYLISRPGAYTTYARYLNTQLIQVGVKCQFDEISSAKFYLVTEFGEEWDDD